jgi:hypothetical protein
MPNVINKAASPYAINQSTNSAAIRLPIRARERGPVCGKPSR